MNKHDATEVAWKNGYEEGMKDGHDEMLSRITFCAECDGVDGTFQTAEKCYCHRMKMMVEPADYCSFGKKVV